MPRRDGDARALRGRPIATTAPAVNDVLTWTGTVWTPQVGGGGGGVRAAPKYVVGNVPYGDTAASYAADGFFYFADPGDGTGIEAALAAAAVTPGDVHIRPGTYSFQAGAAAMPLAVPPGIVVSGAGPCTKLVARQTGDQGIFVLLAAGGGDPSLSMIRDMSLQADDAGALGTGSAAVIKVEGSGARLKNLTINVSTNPLSTLRNAILVATPGVPIPMTAIDDIAVGLNGSTLSTNGGTATSAVRIEEGQVSASNVQVLQGDVGFELQYNGGLGGCILFGHSLYSVEFAQYGYWITAPAVAQNNPAIRITDSVAVARNLGGDNPPLGPSSSACFQLEGGIADTISSCVAIGATYGVRSAPPSGVTLNVQVDDTTIAFCTYGVWIGPRTIDSSVSGCDIGATFSGIANTCSFGVWADSSSAPRTGVDGLVVEGNTIHVDDLFGLGSTCAVYGFGVSDLFVSDNQLDQFGANLSLAAVNLENCASAAVASNSVRSTSDVSGILVSETELTTGMRTSVTGNDVYMINNSAQTSIRVRTSQTTVTGNIVNQQSSSQPSAAIELYNVSNCTVTGNTVRPSPFGPAISVDGGGKNVCSSNTLSNDNPGLASSVVIGASIASDNNVVLGNVCLTTPPVNVAAGVGNEVAHNI